MKETIQTGEMEKSLGVTLDEVSITEPPIEPVAKAKATNDSG